MKFLNKIRMKSIENEFVVEFESECCGSVIITNDNVLGYRIGHYSSSWYSCYDTTVWTPYRNPYRILGSKWRHQ